MQHYNSVFHSVLKQVPWRRFDQLVAEHGADKHVRTLTTKSQLIALITHNCPGGRVCVRSRQVCRATPPALPLAAKRCRARPLADANAQRPWQVFSGLFAHLVGSSRVGSSARPAKRSPDRFEQRSSERAKQRWARFSAGVCGAKMHIVYDPTPFARSMPLSRQPTSMTSLPPRSCRSRPGPPTCSTRLL